MARKKKRLRNIGPVSQQWLNAVGIHSLNDLKAIGSAKAYLMCKDKGFNVGINLLYALEWAVLNLPWYGLSSQIKARLKKNLN